MAMTKKGLTQKEIVSRIAERSGLKKTQAKRLFVELAGMAAREVRNSGEFTLPGIGKLVKISRKAYAGRNPATGKTIRIESKSTVRFRAGKSLVDSFSTAEAEGISDLPDDMLPTSDSEASSDLSGDPLTNSEP